jgi:hypothetical protein
MEAPFDAAAQMEKDLAEDLRADGYTSPVVHRDNSVQSRIEETRQEHEKGH